MLRSFSRGRVFLGLSIISLVSLFGCSPSADVAQVKTNNGQIQGHTEGRSIAFKGIPYAAAPINELRWRAPQPVSPWQGTLQADNFGHDCMQKPFEQDAAPLTTTPSEDCLYLNVWRPKKASDTPYPVVVWIHGGGFVNGGSSPNIYSGQYFGKNKTVFVSVNYRLGRFGFFAHPALSQSLPNEPLANYALMDQIAALKWVNENIAAFGGDPGQITIMGESAGGKSVNALLQSPAAEGLFERAVVMSGGGRALFPLRKLNESTDAMPSAEQIGLAFAERNGIEGSDSKALEALRALPADAIVDGLNLAAMQSPTYVGGPVLDGQIVTAATETNYQQSNFARVPVMIGTTNQDLGFPFARSKEALFAHFGENAENARQIYDPKGDLPLPKLAYEVSQDRMMQEPARFIAQQVAASGQPAWLYRFGYVAQAINKGQGAQHASEIPYFFSTVAEKYNPMTSEQDQQAGKMMHQYVVNFVKFGNPNGLGLPPWPAFDPVAPNRLTFTEEGIPQHGLDPLTPKLDLIQQALAN